MFNLGFVLAATFDGLVTTFLQNNFLRKVAIQFAQIVETWMNFRVAALREDIKNKDVFESWLWLQDVEQILKLLQNLARIWTQAAAISIGAIAGHKSPKMSFDCKKYFGDYFLNK